MKQNKHTTFTGTRTTSADVCRWVQTLLRLHERLAPRFARPEPRRRVLAYLQGILSETSRKNGWQLAEHAGEARPDGMQRLLSQSVWDTDGVRDDLRSYVLELLGQECAILAIDETCLYVRYNQKRLFLTCIMYTPSSIPLFFLRKTSWIIRVLGKMADVHLD